MISFHANHVSVTREEWGDLIFWGAEEELYLMLQAADVYDKQGKDYFRDVLAL